MTDLYLETLTLPGASLGPENPLPFFRNPQPDPPVPISDAVPPEKRVQLGWQTGFRVLPYRQQDDYTRRREPLNFKAIVLENDVLRAIFLPEVGGRLISLFHKPEQRELLFCNPVFQPANLAIRNAWFAGGIEWNIGQYGHAFTTCAPLFAAAIPGLHGEPALRLYEFERCKRLFWQIDFYLPPGSPVLIAYTRAINPSEAATSMYWWTNIAVPEAPDVRVLAPAQQAVCMDFANGDVVYSYTDLPQLPCLHGADGTYAVNSNFANEFFFQCDGVTMPWEAALDGQGGGLVEASTARLRYRKLFCWGQHAGGRHWQDFLSQPGQAYLEIQAGLAPTQLHGLVMPAQTTWDWTQVFGYLQMEPEQAHSADWPTALAAVERSLQSLITLDQLQNLESAARAQADRPPEKILHEGSGWGVLELYRRAQQRAQPISTAFDFPEATLTSEQMKWRHLLEQGCLPEQDPPAAPGEWMVQDEWLERLERSVARPENRNWYALLHLGVMRLEHFDEAGAAAAWQESVRLKPSVWAYRNLAVLAWRRKDESEALAYYQKAWERAVLGGDPPLALAIEYLQMLCAAKQFEAARKIYDSLPSALQPADRIQVLRGRMALELDDLETVEQVLQREYAVIREGEKELTDLWFKMWARRLARQTGQSPDDISRHEIEQRHPLPSRIDFRSVNGR